MATIASKVTGVRDYFRQQKCQPKKPFSREFPRIDAKFAPVLALYETTQRLEKAASGPSARGDANKTPLSVFLSLRCGILDDRRSDSPVQICFESCSSFTA